jgi:hypothetical protein
VTSSAVIRAGPKAARALELGCGKNESLTRLRYLAIIAGFITLTACLAILPAGFILGGIFVEGFPLPVYWLRD